MLASRAATSAEAKAPPSLLCTLAGAARVQHACQVPLRGPRGPFTESCGRDGPRQSIFYWAAVAPPGPKERLSNCFDDRSGMLSMPTTHRRSRMSRPPSRLSLVLPDQNATLARLPRGLEGGRRPTSFFVHNGGTGGRRSQGNRGQGAGEVGPASAQDVARMLVQVS